MSSRWMASIFSGLIAGMIALDCGVPLWRHLPIGDASDFGACTFFAVWYLIKAVRGETIRGA